VLVSSYNLAYGLSQLPGGWLSDRAGYCKLVAVGISGVALSGLLVGFSSTFIAMAVFLVLMGVFGGGYHPSASSLVSASVEEKFRGRALGIHQLGGTASFFLAPLVSVGIANIYGWRGSFLILSVPIFIFGIVLFLLLRSWGYNKVGARYISPGKSKTDKRPYLPNRLPGLHRFPGLLRLVPVIILNSAVQMFLFSILSFIPFYMVDTYGGSKQAAAVLLSIAHFAGFWGGPFGGYLSDRMGRLPIMFIIGVIAGPLILLLNHISMGWSLYLMPFLIGMTAYMSMPVTEAYIIGHAPEQNRSTLLGVYYFAARAGMGLTAPVIGYTIDRWGFGTAFTLFGSTLILIVISCAPVIFIKRRPEK
jgi:MFS family permease